MGKKANRNRRANAEPSGGGGGGGWKATNDRMAANRAKLQGKGLAIGTQEWVNGKIANGDIEGGMSANQSGTSIFDPVLCELIYRWFCPPGGLVLDPFAGGSVRGIVASRLGRPYVGIDLRPEQIKANEAQAKMICKQPVPKWIVGDAMDVAKHMGKRRAQLLFSCPPYADLEVYSENPLDLSTMEHEDFLKAYRHIIAEAVSCLADDSFACFVIGDARDANGFYYGLPWRTVEAFEAAGARLYNEAVLVTAAGSLPIRTAKQFTVSRKLGKTHHQNVLVFVKGDPVEATQAIGPVEFGEIEEPAPATLQAPAGSVDPRAYGEVL